MDYAFYINSRIAHLYFKFKHTPLKESNISRLLFGIASLLSFFEKFYVCTQPNKYFPNLSHSFEYVSKHSCLSSLNM